MYRYRFLSGLFLLFVLLGCSSKSEEGPREELWISYNDYIKSPDGVVYGLRDDDWPNESEIAIVDGQRPIVEMSFEAPRPVEIHVGYGEQRVVNYPCGVFDFLGDNVIVAYYPLYPFGYGDKETDYDDFNNLNGVVYLFDKKLMAMNTKKVFNGHQFIVDNNLVVCNRSARAAIYDDDLNRMKEGNGFSDFYIVNFLAIGRQNDDYYLFAEGDRSLIHDDGQVSIQRCEAIINLFGENYVLISRPTTDAVIDEYFKNESYKPRLSDTSVTYNKDHFEIAYEFKLIDGTKRTVIYDYGCDGQFIGSNLI